MKMITARVHGLKDINISEELGISENEFRVAGESLEKMGISVADSNGILRDMDDILEDVNKIWGTLNKTEQSYLAESVAGNRQRATFISLMDTMTKSQELYNGALNSSGISMEVNSRYVQSFEGRLNVLKSTFETLSATALNSDFLKGFVDGLTTSLSVLTEMTNSLGGLNTALLLLGTTLAVFKGSVISGYISSISTAITSQGLLTAGTTALTGAFTKLKIAIASNPLGLLATVLTTAIASLALFNVKAEQAEAELKSLGDEVRNLNADMANLSVAYENFNASIASGDLEERNQALQELKAILPEISSAVDNENLSIKEQNRLIKERIALKQKEADDKAQDYADGSRKGLTTDLDAIKWQYEEMKELNDLMSNWDNLNKTTDQNGNQFVMDSKGLYRTYDELADAIKFSREEILASEKQAMDFQDAIKGASDEFKIENAELIDMADSIVKYGTDSAKMMEDLFGGIEVPEIDKTEGLDNFGASEKAIQSTEELVLAYQKLGMSAEDAKKTIEGLNEASEGGSADDSVVATDIYIKANSAIQDLQDSIADLNEAGAVTPDLMASFANSYPDILKLGAGINDLGLVQDFLNGKIAESADIANDAYAKMLGGAEDAYTNMILADTEYFNTKVKNTQAWEQFNVDVNNAMMKIHSQMLNSNNKEFANYISSLASGMQVDLSNCKSLAEAKILIERKAVEAISRLWSQYYRTVGQAASKYGDGASVGSYMASMAGSPEAWAKIQAEQAAIKAQAEQMENLFNGLEGQIYGIGAGLNGVTANLSSPNYNGGGSSSGGSSGSSATEKEIEDLTILIDRYRELNDSIDDINQQLEINNLLSENDNSIKLTQEEIKLLQEKKQALIALEKEERKERAEIQKSLSKSGFTFDKSGDITNYKKKLKELQAWANSATGETKEQRIAQVESIQDLIEAYDEIQDKVDETSNDILGINNEIISAQKEIADVIKNQIEEYKQAEEEKTDKLISELEKRKQAMNEQWEEEDYEDELDTEQQKLNDLQSQRADAIRAGNTEIAKDLENQINEQRDIINKLIQDKERDDMNTEFDNQIEEIEKELKDKMDALEETMTEDEILKAVANGATSLGDIYNGAELLSDSVKTTAIGFELWNTQLDTFLDKLSVLNMTDLNLGINSTLKGVNAGNKPNVSMGDITLNIQGGTNMDRTELTNILDDFKDEFVNDINSAFSR